MGIDCEAIKNVLLEGKGEDITTLETAAQSGGLFTHMILATAGSPRHAAALAQRVVKAQKAGGYKKSVIEASQEREWVLIDCGEVIVHIMQASARAHYRLEDLWGM